MCEMLGVCVVLCPVACVVSHRKYHTHPHTHTAHPFLGRRSRLFKTHPYGSHVLNILLLTPTPRVQSLQLMTAIGNACGLDNAL